MWSNFSISQFSIFLGKFYENVTLLSISCYLPKIMNINTNLFEMMLCNYPANFTNCTAMYLVLSTIINF